MGVVMNECNSDESSILLFESKVNRLWLNSAKRKLLEGNRLCHKIKEKVEELGFGEDRSYNGS